MKIPTQYLRNKALTFLCVVYISVVRLFLIHTSLVLKTLSFAYHNCLWFAFSSIRNSAYVLYKHSTKKQENN